MYCKYCGEHNHADQTYCQKCGKVIKTNTISLEKITITESKTAFCKKCGTAVLDRYCTECGTVGYNLEHKNRTGPKVPDMGINLGSIDDIKSKIQNSVLGDIKSVDDVKNIVASKPVIKSSFISALKILGIGLLISLLVFAAISKIEVMEELLYNIDRVANNEYLELEQISKLKPNFIDVFNLSLQSPINLFAKVQGDLYGEKISTGVKGVMSFKLIVLLIIPIIGIFISQLKLFKDEETSKEHLMQYGITSLMFSIMVKILAFVNQKSIKMVNYDGSLNFNLKIGLHDLWSLLSVFLIIFGLQIIISMIMKKDNPFETLNIKQCPDLGSRIMTYIKSIAIFAGIVTTVMLLIYIIIGTKEGGDIKFLTMFGIVMLPAIFIHTWLFSFGANMVTLSTGTKPISVNIWKTWKGISELKGYNYGNSDLWVIWGYIFIIAIFLGIIYVLYKVLKDIEEEGYFVKLGFMAGAISIINIGLSYFASIGLKISNTGGNGNGYSVGDALYYFDVGFLSNLADVGKLKQSYAILSIIVATFIWVFAIGAIIYYLRNNEIYFKVKTFIEDNGKKLIIGYTAFAFISFYLLQTKIMEDMIYMIFNMFPMLEMLL